MASALALITLQLTACMAGYQRAGKGDGSSSGAAASSPRSIPRIQSLQNSIAPGPTKLATWILNFAHRGASATRAEHTLDAYQTALVQGADYLEIDVHGTRDGHLVIVHDASLKRTTGEDRLVRELSLEEIRAVDPNVLTIQQVFEAFPTAPINIEIKQKEPSISATLAEAIRATGREKLVIVSSGSADAIREFRRASQGHVATGAAMSEVLGVYGNYLFGLQLKRPVPFEALQIPYWSIAGIDLSTPEFIAYAHEHALEVHYWTVDEASEMERLIQAGADGIMTNRPDVLAGVIAGLSTTERADSL